MWSLFLIRDPNRSILSATFPCALLPLQGAQPRVRGQLSELCAAISQNNPTRFNLTWGFAFEGCPEPDREGDNRAKNVAQLVQLTTDLPHCSKRGRNEVAMRFGAALREPNSGCRATNGGMHSSSNEANHPTLPHNHQPPFRFPCHACPPPQSAPLKA